MENECTDVGRLAPRWHLLVCFHDSSWEHDGPWKRFRSESCRDDMGVPRYLQELQQQGLVAGSAALAGRQVGWQEPTAVGVDARRTTVALARRACTPSLSGAAGGYQCRVRVS